MNGSIGNPSQVFLAPAGVVKAWVDINWEKHRLSAYYETQPGTFNDHRNPKNFINADTPENHNWSGANLAGKVNRFWYTFPNRPTSHLFSWQDDDVAHITCEHEGMESGKIGMLWRVTPPSQPYLVQFALSDGTMHASLQMQQRGSVQANISVRLSTGKWEEMACVVERQHRFTHVLGVGRYVFVNVPEGTPLDKLAFGVTALEQGHPHTPKETRPDMKPEHLEQGYWVHGLWSTAHWKHFWNKMLRASSGTVSTD